MPVSDVVVIVIALFTILSLKLGLGAMAEWRDIVNIVVDRFHLVLRA